MPAPHTIPLCLQHSAHTSQAHYSAAMGCHASKPAAGGCCLCCMLYCVDVLQCVRTCMCSAPCYAAIVRSDARHCIPSALHVSHLVVLQVMQWRKCDSRFNKSRSSWQEDHAPAKRPCAGGLSTRSSNAPRALRLPLEHGKSQWAVELCVSMYVHHNFGRCFRTWRCMSSPLLPCVQIIDMGSATPEQIQSADAVLLTVRADAKQPFAGMYKYADALALRYSNHATPPRHSTRNTGPSDNNALRIDSGFNCADSIASPLPSARSTVSGWGQSPTPGEYAGDAPSFVVGGCTAPGLPAVGRLDTGSTASSIRERVPTVYRTLALNTAPAEGKDPFNKFMTRRRKRSFHADVPVAVAVTACDVVDSEEHKAAHPGHVAMLRSTAANWSNARRCRVTFLFAKSGIGVSGAMSHLVHEVATHRRRLGTQ